MKNIFLIPGHGGKDSGAVGPGGSRECDLNLTIALSCRDMLRSMGFKSNSSRDSDTYISPSGQAGLANQFAPDFSLAIHCNAGGGKGFEAFTSPGDTSADPIATHLLNTFLGAFPNRVMRTDPSDGDPDKESKFAVLVGTKHPCVLFECGFIDNAEEEQFLIREAKNIGEILAHGIYTYFTKDAAPIPTTPPTAPAEDPFLVALAKAIMYHEELGKFLTSIK